MRIDKIKNPLNTGEKVSKLSINNRIYVLFDVLFETKNM